MIPAPASPINSGAKGMLAVTSDTIPLRNPPATDFIFPPMAAPPALIAPGVFFPNAPRASVAD